MAKTLSEILADCGMDDSQGQTKTASAKPSTTEVDQVLENLGLDSTTVKTASEKTQTGGNMNSLQSVYEQIFGEDTATETVKTASEQVETPAQKTETEDFAKVASAAFGEATATYFNELLGAYSEALEKTAGSVESEAGAGEQPLHHIQPSGGLTSAIGKPADPAMPVNHSASSKAPAQVATKGQTPYSLKGAAMKEILKRIKSETPGGTIQQ
jgi:hypothetical protein